MNEQTLASQILPLMQARKMPGLSLAFVNGGEMTLSLALGSRNVDVGEPVTKETMFEAASLSKPLFSYAVLQLVDAGKIDLDEPLCNFGGSLIPDDPAASQITIRHVLSHTTGLPNWRRDEFPLRTYFKPGTRFSYSGEGFAYLQSVIECVVKEPFNALMTQLVFEPLGMKNSSYICCDRLLNNYAAPHDDKGKTQDKFWPRDANAAWSLATTAEDYGRFLIAARRGERLKAATAEQWFTAQVHVPEQRFEALDAESPIIDTTVAWGLGWGLEPEANVFFHWGSNGDAEAFTLGSLINGAAVVMFMNGATGLILVPEIVEAIMPGKHSSLRWLGLLEAR